MNRLIRFGLLSLGTLSLLAFTLVMIGRSYTHTSIALATFAVVVGILGLIWAVIPE